MNDLPRFKDELDFPKLIHLSFAFGPPKTPSPDERSISGFKPSTDMRIGGYKNPFGIRKAFQHFSDMVCHVFPASLYADNA